MLNKPDKTKQNTRTKATSAKSHPDCKNVLSAQTGERVISSNFSTSSFSYF